MFDSAHAVPASTVTSRVATAADIVAFRDNHFFIVILLGVIDARELCRSRRQSFNSVSFAAPRAGQRGSSLRSAAFGKRSGNRSAGWAYIFAVRLALSVSNSLSGRHWELDQVPAVGDPAHRCPHPHSNP